MINLIPDNIKKNNYYASRNLTLVGYVITCVLTIVLILMITGFGLITMRQKQASLQKQIGSQAQELAKYKPLEQQGEALSKQISTINSLLDRQVTFSNLLPNISKMLPPGAVLKQLNFSTDDVSGPTTGSQAKSFVISAAVKDRSVAASLLENIKANKDLFSGAEIQQISPVGGVYAYDVSINAFFSKNALKNLSSINNTSLSSGVGQ